jgi:hypothetical protein
VGDRRIRRSRAATRGIWEGGMSTFNRRLAGLADALLQGLWPLDDCPACRAIGGGCPGCAQRSADRNLIDGKVLPAIRDATTGREALAHFAAGLLELTGVSAGQMLAAVTAAHLMRAHGADGRVIAREMAAAAGEQ